MSESGTVNEPSVFESLKFYCITVLSGVLLKGTGYIFSGDNCTKIVYCLPYEKGSFLN